MKTYEFRVNDLKFKVKYIDKKLAQLDFGYNLEIEDSEIDEKVYPLINYLEEYLNGENVTYNRNLYLQGTKKQKLVLKECMNIKRGETISYKELGNRCGIKNGGRFIGNVMANNKIPIIIPCHRVIKSNGKLGNYGSGVDIKKRLINIERGI